MQLDSLRAIRSIEVIRNTVQIYFADFELFSTALYLRCSNEHLLKKFKSYNDHGFYQQQSEFSFIHLQLRSICDILSFLNILNVELLFYYRLCWLHKYLYFHHNLDKSVYELHRVMIELSKTVKCRKITSLN